MNNPVIAEIQKQDRNGDWTKAGELAIHEHAIPRIGDGLDWYDIRYRVRDVLWTYPVRGGAGTGEFGLEIRVEIDNDTVEAI
ncbi:hypothetical protein ABT369_39500 [Dactylosporangium sp. NPDC000244]|uniref:hypothetical protein n=1 Tax=Dactylosporangium sp. NPDC000244 TaxID=3154365 RepID=UPI003326624F